MEGFMLRFPLGGDYMTTVRLTTGGICAMAGFDIDKAEDLKVCVTESLLILKRNEFCAVSVRFFPSEGDGVLVNLSGEESSGKEVENAEDEISYALLGALTDRADFTKEKGKVTAITLFAR